MELVSKSVLSVIRPGNCFKTGQDFPVLRHFRANSPVTRQNQADYTGTGIAIYISNLGGHPAFPRSVPTLLPSVRTR